MDTLKVERRECKVETALRKLKEAGINFDPRNNNQHLIVEGFECYIDFWPSTGRWNTRFGFKGFGLANLIVYVKQPS